MAEPSAGLVRKPLGTVFTRREVVDFILDLVGYTPESPLSGRRILEPSFGSGNFLLPIVARLLASCRKRGVRPTAPGLSDAIRAVEIDEEAHRNTAAAVVELLRAEGLADEEASSLAGHWLANDDFLLAKLDGPFDFVVGNPPYVRQEDVPAGLMDEYRKRYRTIYDRADIYVPFIERSLSLLADGGRLGFICADRWLKNRYGGPLRRLIAGKYHFKAYVNVSEARAFHSNVSAYPGVIVIGNGSTGALRVAQRPSIEPGDLRELARTLTGPDVPEADERVYEVAELDRRGGPWLLERGGPSDLIRRLEAALPTLEQAGCAVGIGVATGADKAFIGKFDAMDVEPDRKLPLVTTKDIASGEVSWRGDGVINPFADDGRLVDLWRYPRLRRYLEERRNLIAGRHCAMRNPSGWYRTLDKITPSLAKKPKLLIPDIKLAAHVVFEDGRLYPHHNLYHVTSGEWNLRALQAVLLSRVTGLFIRSYCTTLRGGTLRFQAQYLRLLRVPRWADVPDGIRAELAAAAIRRDQPTCDRVACELYGLSPREMASLGAE
jgi:hypothetical protein